MLILVAPPFLKGGREGLSVFANWRHFNCATVKSPSNPPLEKGEDLRRQKGQVLRLCDQIKYLHQLFFHCGFRFSKNAATPSF